MLVCSQFYIQHMHCTQFNFLLCHGLQIRLSELLGADWRSGVITDVGSYPPPHEPVRSTDKLNVVAPGKEAKRGKGGTLVRV